MWIIGLAIVFVILLGLIVLKIKKWKNEGFSIGRGGPSSDKVHAAVNGGTIEEMKDALIKSHGAATYVKLAQEANMVKMGLKNRIPKSQVTAILSGKDTDSIMKK